MFKEQSIVVESKLLCLRSSVVALCQKTKCNDIRIKGPVR